MDALDEDERLREHGEGAGESHHESLLTCTWLDSSYAAYSLGHLRHQTRVIVGTAMRIEEIRAFDVTHEDLRLENILWNDG
jgi:hypothetical protein